MTVCSILVCALKLLAACAPEFHSVRPAAAFVAIVMSAPIPVQAAVPSGHGFANLLPVLADKHSLAAACCHGTQH